MRYALIRALPNVKREFLTNVFTPSGRRARTKENPRCRGASHILTLRTPRGENKSKKTEGKRKERKGEEGKGERNRSQKEAVGAGTECARALICEESVIIRGVAASPLIIPDDRSPTLIIRGHFPRSVAVATAVGRFPGLRRGSKRGYLGRAARGRHLREIDMLSRY